MHRYLAWTKRFSLTPMAWHRSNLQGGISTDGVCLRSQTYAQSLQHVMPTIEGDAQMTPFRRWAVPAGDRCLHDSYYLDRRVGIFPSPARAADNQPDGISWRTAIHAQPWTKPRQTQPAPWIQFTGPGVPTAHGWNGTRSRTRRFASMPGARSCRSSSAPCQRGLGPQFNLSGLPATVIVAPVAKSSRSARAISDPRSLRTAGRRAVHARHRAEPRRCAGLDLEAQIGDEIGPEAVPVPKPVPGQASWHRHPTARPKTEYQVALSGFCPVSLISDKRLVQGQTEYTVTHEGRLYRFANLLTFNLFRRDPERYVPVNNGNCPVVQIERGVRAAGRPAIRCALPGPTLPLRQRRRPTAVPGGTLSRYAVVDVAEQGFCPHCLAQDGVLVRGDPQYDLNRDGRRYWFPDPTHREAFLAAVESVGRSKALISSVRERRRSINDRGRGCHRYAGQVQATLAGGDVLWRDRLGDQVACASCTGRPGAISRAIANDLRALVVLLAQLRTIWRITSLR